MSHSLDLASCKRSSKLLWLSLFVLSLIVGAVTLAAASRVYAQTSGPNPVVTLDLFGTNDENVPPEVLLSSPFQFIVTFENQGSAIGYGPYIDLLIPIAGLDGTTGGGPCDGIDFLSASFLNIPVNPLSGTPVYIPSASAPTCGSYPTATKHPITGAALSPAYDEYLLVVLDLPFGSFVPDQPAIEVLVTLYLSDWADVSQPLTIYSQGGFKYGDDVTGNSPPVTGTTVNDQTIPNVITVSKKYLGPESETSSGPNFPRQYEIHIDIADGEQIDNVLLSEFFSEKAAFLQIISMLPGGSVVNSPPVGTAVKNQPLQIDFGTVTGTSANPDIIVVVEMFIPEFDADGNPILDPASCLQTHAINDVKAEGDWAPTDTRDGISVHAVSDVAKDDHNLSGRCVAIQKDAFNLDDGGADVIFAENRPGDLIEYLISVQVSDFITLDDLLIFDDLSDGQDFDLSQVATLTMTDKYGVTTGNFSLGSDLIVDASQRLTCGDGRTQITFDVSQALANLAQAQPNGIITGGHANGATNVPAVAQIRFWARVSDAYACPTPGDIWLDKHDVLTNNIRMQATVLDNLTLQPSGGIAQDVGGKGFSLAAGELSKTIYAINGDPFHPELANPKPRLAPGDTVTFRLVYDSIPSSDAEQFVVRDYLPLPVLHADAPTGSGGSWSFITTQSPAPPPAGSAWPHSADQLVGFTGAPGYCSGFTSFADTASNSLCFDFGSFNDPTNTPRRLDLLFTLTVTNDPFVDGLAMTNEAAECEKDSGLNEYCQLAVAQFTLTQPNLRIRKGVVATSKPSGQFSPAPPAPVTFTPPPNNSCPRFTGQVNSTNSFNSDLNLVDLNDWVTFAIVIENTGSGLYGAFDTQLQDLLDPNLINPQNLCVTDGNGTPLLYGGSLFPSGSTLNLGPIPAYHPTNGKNIVIITFDAQIGADASGNLPAMGQCLSNKADLTHFASTVGGKNYVGSGFATGPFSDTARVCMNPVLFKGIVATSEAHTLENVTPRPLAIGEIARFRLTMLVPEGVAPNFRLVDTLPSGFSLLPNTTRLALVGNGTGFLNGIGSSNPALGACRVVGNSPFVTPTCLFPPASISVAPNQSGDVITFDFSNLVNFDNDNDSEWIILEFNAQVLNALVVGGIFPVAVNNDGDIKTNTFRALTAGTDIGGASVQAQIVEPHLTLTKTVDNPTSSTSGVVTFTITVANDGHAAAFDSIIADVLPAGLSLVGSPTVTSSGATGVTVKVSGLAVSANIERLNINGWVKVTLQALLKSCEASDNPAGVSYTSLPGRRGTLINPTGSVTAGNSGEGNGERTGISPFYIWGGINDYIAHASAGPLCSIVCGNKFEDMNGDGIWQGKNSNEPQITGWEIIHVWAGQNGQFEPINNIIDDVLEDVDTNASYGYCFYNVRPGKHRLIEAQKSDWIQTAPSTGFYEFSIGLQQTITGKVFGNFRPASISGVKWLDNNGDGQHDSGEPGLGGWTIELYDQAGNLVATTTTAADGSYSFSGLRPGAYQVSEVQQSGYTQTAPVEGVYDIELISNQTLTDIDFGNWNQTGSVEGVKWLDENADGVRDPGEHVLPNWPITITASSGTSQTVLTDGNGHYSFTNLAPGTYTVSESVPAGWLQTAPPGGTYTVNVTSGGVVSDLDCGNCNGLSIQYTTQNDFNNGSPTALKPPFQFNTVVQPSTPASSTVLPSGEVTLLNPPTTFPFINVAVSNRGGDPRTGTVVRIHTEPPYEIVGEYLTAPNNMQWERNPSRTTVDSLGNVWVANRGANSQIVPGSGNFFGSITRIGLMWGGLRYSQPVDDLQFLDPAGQYVLFGTENYTTCVDQDGDGFIRTSSGLGDILPWVNTPGTDDDGANRLAIPFITAEDECILNYTRVRGTNTRTIAVSPVAVPHPNPTYPGQNLVDVNDVWVGGANSFHELVDGNTGAANKNNTAFAFLCGGYGGLVDSAGVLWSARYPNNNSTLRYDPAHNDPLNDAQCLTVTGSYGLAVDNDGDIWNSRHVLQTITELWPSGVQRNNFPLALSPLGEWKGVAVTPADNHVWIAYQRTPGIVRRLDGSGAFLVDIPVGDNPTGLAVDSSGMVWVTNMGSGNAMRIEPNKNQVVATINLGPGAQPYNYSDMTGLQLMQNPPKGFWQVTEDSGQPGTHWCRADWNQESTGVQENHISVELRAADTLGGLSGATWVTVPNGMSFANLNLTGQFLEIRVRLIQPSLTAPPPILRDLTVRACCECVEKEEKVLAEDGTDRDLFGEALSIQGDLMVVGARQADGATIDSGAAYVYHRSSGGWTQVAKLTASDGVIGDRFGYDVALSTDQSTIVVGAYYKYPGGAAYVYEQSVGGVWTEVGKLTASDATLADHFGFSVAASFGGNTIVIGARQADLGSNFHAGAAYVFERGSGWSNRSENAKLTAKAPASLDELGFDVDISADGATIAAGAPNRDIAGQNNAGAVFIFSRPGAAWSGPLLTEVALLSASLPAAGAQLGFSIAIDGSNLLAGAPAFNGGTVIAGSAYLFQGSGPSWQQAAAFQSSTPTTSDLFGWSVDLEGSLAAIGARGVSSYTGTMYVFTSTQAGWTLNRQITAADVAFGDGFGVAVGISGNRIASGAMLQDDFGPASGAVYVFDVCWSG
jgi:uncharacterized repeat protein (TIGR01451 family)